MDFKPVVVCLFVCVSFGGVFGQAGSLCRPNERLLECGCPKTCRDPVPDCKGVCKTGCFCDEGMLRDEDKNGICVKLADCPKASAYKLETTEPRHHQGKCPEDQEYRFCEPCNRSCENPFPKMCPAQCSMGCFCKGNLLMDKNGKCVKFEECSNYNAYIEAMDSQHASVAPIPYRFSCGENKQYHQCKKCTQTCNDPEPVCGECKAGCFCKDGFIKRSDGACVEQKDCPKAQATFSTAQFSSIDVEDCSSGEEYFSCGWCESTCQDPSPNCPDACTRGCLCRPPMLRHSSGQCVPKEQCKLRNCSDPNKEYTCRYGCEHGCSKNLCPRATTVGSGVSSLAIPNEVCYRDAPSRCVKEDQCNNNVEEAITSLLWWCNIIVNALLK